ncbi:MAG TPA: carboxylating nicotinate-nucleotide diphosphorylase [Mycobacteriales bacterium]|jgi:nicotinate-nucleotide pyrophosphorylase (carboxylating)|nr:carboxylating nicotinate-nucleotide diphosphorylase [Mycobacteriales bacterium]
MGADTRRLLAAGGLDPAGVQVLVDRALAEDLDGGLDVTSVATIPFDAEGSAVFVPRREGVLAGLAIAAAVMQSAGDDDVLLEFLAADGDLIAPGQPLLRVRGLLRTMLTAERTALNLLGHLSGVASLTRTWAAACAPAKVRDTRKTTPGLRAIEKYAVRCGGGVNHRLSLSDAALIKDNHVLAAGGVAAAYAAVRSTFPDLPVEVECDTVAQVREALGAGVDLILCDNMVLADLRAAVELARDAGVRTEASGGLTLDSARAIAATGVDFLAVGALTHSAPVLDIGFDLERP